MTIMASKFLSTPSARRATSSGARPCAASGYFYPRPPRGGRRPASLDHTECSSISIHALREEGDTATLSVMSEVRDFYPRPPRGGRHAGTEGLTVAKAISIHALREEGDLVSMVLHTFLCYFYPRPPRGGRRSWTLKRLMILRFLSTPSARRATKKLPTIWRGTSDFYPRPPRGGRLLRTAS